MAESGNGEVNDDFRQRCLARFIRLQNELEALGVKREEFDFEQMEITEICEIGAEIADQLKRKKKCSGVK